MVVMSLILFYNKDIDSLLKNLPMDSFFLLLIGRSKRQHNLSTWELSWKRTVMVGIQWGFWGTHHPSSGNNYVTRFASSLLNSRLKQGKDKEGWKSSRKQYVHLQTSGVQTFDDAPMLYCTSMHMSSLHHKMRSESNWYKLVQETKCCLPLSLNVKRLILPKNLRKSPFPFYFPFYTLSVIKHGIGNS